MRGATLSRQKAQDSDLHAGVYVTNGTDLFCILDRHERFIDTNGNLTKAQVLLEDAEDPDDPYWVDIDKFLKVDQMLVRR